MRARETRALVLQSTNEQLEPRATEVYMRTTTIRVAVETRDRLNEIARRRGQPAREVVAALMEEADDHALLATAFADWERLCADSDAIGAYRAGIRELDSFDTALPD
jgi:predicted DNA-binding protein